jgi:methionyl-tRNA synthetase
MSKDFNTVDELATSLALYVTLATPVSADGATVLDTDELGVSLRGMKGTTDSEAKTKAAGAAAATTESTKGSSTVYDRWSLLDESSIDYGYLAHTRGAGIGPNVSKTFYLTTAINYANGPGHMGHAYEAATSDVIVRYQRLTGENDAVYFLTGSDEHGQKIADTAVAQEMEPLEMCDKYVTGFQVLNQRTKVSNDDYLRTTSDRHKRTAQALWKKCHEAGDIYLDNYSGWYNIREEKFVPDNEAQMADFKDPVSGKPLKRVEEESYFFKMSKYHDQLVKYIEDNPSFIRPEQYRNEILSFLKADQLRDLSISRTTFSWGIPVPEGFNDKHVMYVWVDALTNYLTGVNGLGVNEDGSIEHLERFWPASVHVIGKDILRFHTVYWTTLLMSAGIPLPKTVFAHGFVNDGEGKKMSKSLGNVIDPHDMLDKFESDTFRWYLCKEAAFGAELSFSEDSMRTMHNADLCDTIGNLVNRATNLCKKYCDGKVPDVPPPSKLPIDFSAVVEEYKKKMEAFDLQGGANVACQAYRDINGWLQEEAPWKLKGDEYEETRKVTVRCALEVIYAVSHLVLPFLTTGAKKIFQKLGTEPVALKDIKLNCRNLEVGTEILLDGILYEKSLSDEEKNDKKGESTRKKDSFAEAKRKKEEARKKAIAASQKGAQAGNADQPDFTKIEIRVGQIVKVWNHEEADKLFCEQIDLGEEGGPRQIASGLREHYTLEQMQDRKVLVVCNLKAQKLVGFESNGMVLAAKGDGKVELVEPPAEAAIGERVFIEGLSGEPWSSTQVRKKKLFEAVASGLKTNGDAVATWEDKVIQTQAGPCKAATLTSAPIS